MKSELKLAATMAIIVIGAIAGLGVAFSYLDQPVETISVDNKTLQTTPFIDKSRLQQAPSIVGIADYINTSPEELSEMIQGKVVLYDIWTYSCINCIRTLPFITAWNDKYADEGLLIIGIHSPEFEFEKDYDNVLVAVEKYSITYPVVLDNDKETWKAFKNKYWPRKYIADHEGFIRYNHIGEGAYDETERVIQQLLQERASAFGIQTASAELVDIKEFEHSFQKTPELYFGYGFARGGFGNAEGYLPNNNVTYAIPNDGKIYQNKFYVDGTWKNNYDSMSLVSDTGLILLPYKAKEVNIVASGDATLEILLDGEPIPQERFGKDVTMGGIVEISNSGLYNIISSNQNEEHLLTISVDDSGFEIFTFTFG